MVNGVDVEALIDTGATHSIMDFRVNCLLGLIPNERKVVSMFLADDSTMKCVGEVSCDVTIDNVSRCVKFQCVKNFKYDLLVGFDLHLSAELNVVSDELLVKETLNSIESNLDITEIL
jgi:hypothetical protein